MSGVSSEATTEDKKQLFLANYPKVKRIIETCRATAIGTTKFYTWLEEDKIFRERWEAIKKELDQARLEQYEKELDNRALSGASKQSDILLMFGLKALDPNKYREKQAITPIIGDIKINWLIPPHDERPQLNQGTVEGEYKEVE